MQDLIWRMLGFSLADGRIITARLDVRPKLEMIETFAPRRLGNPKLREKIFEAIDIIRIRQADRNFIIHGSWGTMVPQGVPAAMSLKDDSSPDDVVTETFPEGRMREIINDLETALERLRQVLRELPPSPDKLSPPTHAEASPPRPNLSLRSTSKRRRPPKASSG